MRPESDLAARSIDRGRAARQPALRRIRTRRGRYDLVPLAAYAVVVIVCLGAWIAAAWAAIQLLG